MLFASGDEAIHKAQHHITEAGIEERGNTGSESSLAWSSLEQEADVCRRVQKVYSQRLSCGFDINRLCEFIENRDTGCWTSLHQARFPLVPNSNQI